MQSRLGTFIAVAAATVALSATPAAGQHRGGHGGHGGHSSGGHGGHSGGHSSAGHRGTHSGSHAVRGHAGSGHTVRVHSPGRLGHTVFGRTRHHSHLALGAFGLGLGYAAYPYVSPYGYGYRYGSYGYPSYGYGYGGYSSRYYGSSGYYGGYSGSAHARLRIVDAPPDAEVYVDGYYAGLVDDFDGRLQHLELEPGAHQIEILAPDFSPIVFHVRAVDGRTITYRARLVPNRR